MSDGDGSKQISADGQLSEGNLYEGSYQDFAAEYGITPTGWAQAYAKDERSHQPTRRGDTPRQRSWQSRRASWRARERWQTTVRRWSTDLNNKRSSPSSPYTKGGYEGSSAGLWASMKAWFRGLMSIPGRS
jgi:hypothetical protein